MIIILQRFPEDNKKPTIIMTKVGFVGVPCVYAIYGVPKGIRTPVAAVKGRCPRPLDDGD
jgi:hypothetical protein